jgi:hypothetical protein
MHEQAMSRLQNIKILVLGAVGVCLLLALTPVVSYLAGRSTLVDINIAVALTVSVSVGWAITGGIAHQRGRSLRRVEGRNKDLERRLHEASFQVEEYRSETAALRARWEQEVVTSSHLREDLEALRGDLVRLRDDAHPHGARGA